MLKAVHHKYLLLILYQHVCRVHSPRRGIFPSFFHIYQVITVFRILEEINIHRTHSHTLGRLKNDPYSHKVYGLEGQEIHENTEFQVGHSGLCREDTVGLSGRKPTGSLTRLCKAIITMRLELNVTSSQVIKPTTWLMQNVQGCKGNLWGNHLHKSPDSTLDLKFQGVLMFVKERAVIVY